MEREVGAGFLEGEVVLVNLNSSKHQWPGLVLASSDNGLTVEIFDKVPRGLWRLQMPSRFPSITTCWTLPTVS